MKLPIVCPKCGKEQITEETDIVICSECKTPFVLKDAVYERYKELFGDKDTAGKAATDSSRDFVVVAGVLTEYKGTDSDVVIPSGVKRIGGAFAGSGITSVVIPDSVTDIEEKAFSECKYLESVTIGSGVKNIGDYVFERCTSLASIEIPSSVTSIGGSAFYYCSKLTSITIPDSVTSIDVSAFYGCSSLTSITIPSGVKSIRWKAFEYCSKLTSITIPSSVTSIGGYAFYGCSSLTSITFGANSQLTSIGEWAFAYCSSLTSITFKGTRAQWNAIIKRDCWNSDTGKYTVHCTDGDITK